PKSGAVRAIPCSVWRPAGVIQYIITNAAAGDVIFEGTKNSCPIYGSGGDYPSTMISDRTAPPASTMPDLADCLERVRRGDQRAARELVAAVRPMVGRIVRAHLPRRDAPEDLEQEVFMKM